LELVKALEKKAEDSSKIFEALVNRGAVLSFEHMQKLWKKKSLFYAGKSELLRKNFESSIDFLGHALQIIRGDPNFSKEEEEINGLLAKARAGKKKVAMKEKNMYSKALQSLSKEDTTGEAPEKHPAGARSKPSPISKAIHDMKALAEGNNPEIGDDDTADDSGDWMLPTAMIAVGLVTIVGFLWYRSRK